MPNRTLPAVALALGLSFGATLVGGRLPVLSPGGTLNASMLKQGGRGEAPTPAVGTKQVVDGTDGDDLLNGGDGDDWIFGKKGNDFLRGGRGADKIDGGEGEDIVDGGPGDDILDVCEGNDTVRGGDGNDAIDGGDDDDVLDGGAGGDDIDGGDGNDILRGGAGNDVLSGGDENDFLDGGAGNDRLSGNDSADVLRGGVGDDVLLGADGDDDMSGDTGEDTLDGGRGNDSLRGGLGQDTLLGSAGNDALDGGEGHDILFGGDGADVIIGGSGDDLITGGTDSDVLRGNDGNDLFVLRAGDAPTGQTETIDGGLGTNVLILNGFAKAPAFPGSGTGGTMSLSEWQLVDPSTGGIFRIVNIQRVEFTQILAEVQGGADRAVSVLLVNPSTTTTTGRVLFFGADGGIVRAAVIGGQPAADELTFTVPPLGSVLINARVPGPAIAQVFAASPVGAIVRSDAGGPAASALAETPLIDTALIPVLENRTTGFGTGVLIANSLARSALKLTLYAMDGQEIDSDMIVGSKDVDLPAYGHAVLFIKDIFPRLGDFQGSMSVDGGIDRAQEGGSIAVVALERGQSGRIASSPAVAMSPPIRKEPIQIAALSSGADASASIVLLNPSTTAAAQGTLRFFDDAGSPWSVAINRQPPATTISYDLPPRGSAIFATAANGPVQHGSARVDPAQGAIGAFLRASAGAAGNASHVTPSGVFTSFISPARRDRSSGMTTQVSLGSTGTPVVLQLKLRSAAGAEVPGATVEIRLAANGQTTKTLEQLFPTAAADAFEGTLTVMATGGNVAAAVTQNETETSRQIVLPAVSLR